MNQGHHCGIAEDSNVVRNLQKTKNKLFIWAICLRDISVIGYLRDVSDNCGIWPSLHLPSRSPLSLQIFDPIIYPLVLDVCSTLLNLILDDPL